jgi:hypothetical protein
MLQREDAGLPTETLYKEGKKWENCRDFWKFDTEIQVIISRKKAGKKTIYSM